jgi:hypothetical protein
MPTGPVKITVDTRSAQPSRDVKGPPAGMKPPANVNLPPEAAKSGIYGGEQKKKTAEWIPDHYSDPQKSDLDYTVTSGSQTKNIDLK